MHLYISRLSIYEYLQENTPENLFESPNRNDRYDRNPLPHPTNNWFLIPQNFALPILSHKVPFSQIHVEESRHILSANRESRRVSNSLDQSRKYRNACERKYPKMNTVNNALSVFSHPSHRAVVHGNRYHAKRNEHGPAQYVNCGRRRSQTIVSSKRKGIKCHQTW